MAREGLVRWCLRLGVLTVAAWVPWAAWAGDSVKGLGPSNPNQETVDFFAAIEKGQIAVQLIPRDAWQCRLLLSNKTEKPLNVRLPDVFAGVPVSAQFMPNGNNANANRNRPSGKNASQALGVTPQMGKNANNGNPLMNMANPGNGRNQRLLFSIAPEVPGQLKLISVCLEHGKPTPRANKPYEIRPIEGVTSKAEVEEVVRMLGQGELSQAAAQAAVWHLNNGLTWEKLEAEKTSKLNVPAPPMFSSRELADAKKAVEQAAKRCKQNASVSPTQSAAR